MNQTPGFTNKTYGADRIGLVIFHDTARIIASPAEPHDHSLQERVCALPGLVGGSGTNLTAGIRSAMQLAMQSPAGCLRRIWLLTDGKPNIEENGLWTAVEDARKCRININTIGFGDPGSRDYDPELLERIAKATHNGRFIPVDSLRSLSEALKKNNGQNRHHRREVTVMAIDCSPSMGWPMEKKQRIEVVVEALMHLLRYKQKCFA